MEQKQLNIKDASTEQLALFLSEQYEKVMQCRNNILLIHNEINKRIASKEEDNDDDGTRD